MNEQLLPLFTAAKKASKSLSQSDTQTKNDALKAIADALKANADKIAEANALDLALAKQNGITDNMLDRLMLDKKRIFAIAEDTLKVASLPDPVGETVESWVCENGLRIKKVRVPFGVIGAIYESRPNVTVDISSLCLKTGNACILKGGKEADKTNRKLVEIIKTAISPYLDEACVTLLPSDRSVTDSLITAHGYVDLVFPRGGKGLIGYVLNNATVPVIETGAGVCHMYVESTADYDMAEKVLINGKTSRPAVCNSLETLLIDEAVAASFLPRLAEAMRTRSVTLHANDNTRRYIDALPMQNEDYRTEYDALDLSVKVVKGIDEAIEHINEYGTHHSECIITQNEACAKRFTSELDSACVYVNCSTRFTDGGCFGFGAELGISTQKLHARGPMGLKEMTSYHYIIEGKGQVR